MLADAASSSISLSISLYLSEFSEAGFLNIAELEINSRITRDSRAQD